MSLQKSEKYIIVTIILEKVENIWNVKCEELGTATFGNTFDEALKNIKEAVELHLNTLEDVGECEAFLKKNKIEVFSKKPFKKSVVKNVPLNPNIFIQSDIQPLHCKNQYA